MDSSAPPEKHRWGSAPLGESTGALLFRTYCAACHGPQGEGRIGPALNATGRVPQMDEATLREVIRQGRPGTAMPAWGERLSEAEIEALIRFLRELGREPSPLR